jgi:hypothetical protein
MSCRSPWVAQQHALTCSVSALHVTQRRETVMHSYAVTTHNPECPKLAGLRITDRGLRLDKRGRLPVSTGFVPRRLGRAGEYAERRIAMQRGESWVV